MENRITEKVMFRLLGVILVFLLLVFNRDLGNIYLLMIFVDFLFWTTDKFVTLETEKVNNRVKSIVYAVVAYVVFFGANILIRSIFGENTGLQAVLTDLSSTTPILQNSNFLTLLGWGMMIPIIESRFFFGRILEAVCELFNVNMSHLIINARTVFISLMIGAGFALFHITSKNLENVPLMLTFIFGFISCILVLKEKQLFSAILFHILTNTTAVLFTFRPSIFSALGMI